MSALPGAERRAALTAVLAVVLATVMLAVGALRAVPTVASWTDTETVHGQVGTGSLVCGADARYVTRSDARFLSGSLLRTNLDALASLRGMNLVRPGAAAAAPTPTNAVNLGVNDGDPTLDTFGNPLAVSALGGIAGLDLTGLSVGLPVGSAGPANQYTQVTSTGRSVAASGLVSNTGGVLVSGDTPPATLPGRARVSLSGVLPAVANVSDARLAVGAVGSSASLDWCGALRSSVWGDGSVTGVTRSYGIAGLDLEVASPLVRSLTSSVSSTVNALNSAVPTLAGTNGLISQAIRSSILAGVTNLLRIGTVTGTVTVTNLNLSAALGGLLTTPLSDGGVTVDLASGIVRVNLATLLGDGARGLNDLPPNHEVVLDAALLNGIGDRVRALLTAWTAQVTTALTAAIGAATVTVNQEVTLTNLLNLGNVLRLNVSFSSSLANVLNGTTQATVTASVLGGLVGIDVTALTTLLRTSIITSVAGTLTTQLSARVTALGTTLATTRTSLVTALGSVVSALPSVVSLRVNVQPDRPGAPPGSTFDPGAPPWTSPAYSVAALRLGLFDSLAPANGFAYATFARSTVGPSTAPY
ncbi:choice-of-anchor G family protein [Sanguibacter suaedae]|uniref:Choice-of-anchor G family protein n=1 Tax=Sanguibacter suaedae TaxID=2795737 RepID=A0A934ICX4_9MICO|nr:choice-of-anchor G family protein [Sanguibacter suaedae]MBI9115643.1 choice-of-anchor G family protein [Sanguibacter suaedae]